MCRPAPLRLPPIGRYFFSPRLKIRGRAAKRGLGRRVHAVLKAGQDVCITSCVKVRSGKATRATTNAQPILALLTAVSGNGRQRRCQHRQRGRWSIITCGHFHGIYGGNGLPGHGDRATRKGTTPVLVYGQLVRAVV